MVDLKRIVFFTMQKLENGHYSLRTRDGFSFDYKGITLTIHSEGSDERLCVSDADSGLLVKTFDIYDSEVRGFIGKAEKVVQRVYSLKTFHDDLCKMRKSEYYKNVKKAYKCLLEARSYMQNAERLRGGN